MSRQDLASDLFRIGKGPFSKLVCDLSHWDLKRSLGRSWRLFVCLFVFFLKGCVGEVCVDMKGPGRAFFGVINWDGPWLLFFFLLLDAASFKWLTHRPWAQ